MANHTINYNQEQHELEKIIRGGGEMGRAIRSYNWSKTPMGPIAEWPIHLKFTTNLIINSPASIALLWGKEGYTIYNDKYISFAGERHPGLLGKRCEEIWPEASEFIRNVINTCFMGESLSYYRFPYQVFRNKIPEYIWFDLECSPIYGENGNCEGVMIIHNEVTEQVTTENILKKAEERYRIAIDAGGIVGTWEWDPKSDFIIADARFAALYSVNPDLAISGVLLQNFINAIHPEDQDKVVNSIKKSIASKEPYSEEYRIIKKEDNTIRWVLAKGQGYYNEDGEAIRFPGVVVDITEQKEIEQALKESVKISEGLLAERTTVLNQLTEGVIITDATGKIIYLNEAAKNLHGINMLNIFPENYSKIYKLFTIDGAPYPWQELPLTRALLKDEIVLNEYWKIKRPDGIELLVMGSARPVFSPDNIKIGAVLTLWDETERKKAENALAYQNKITKIITENATVALFLMDENGKTTFANPAAEKMTGFSFDEMKGIILHELIHHSKPDGSPFPMEYCTIGKTVFNSGNLSNHEDVFIKKDGSFFPILCSASAIKDNGEIIGIVLEVQDISERKQAEIKLIESEKKFRALADNISQMAWIADENANIFWYNKRWYDFTGTSLEDMKGWGWKKVHHPDLIDKVLEEVKVKFETGKTWEGTYFIKGKNTQYRWFLTRAVPIKDEKNKVWRWFGTNTDITEQKELTEALKESEKRFRSLANSSPSLIWIMDEHMNLTYLNKTFLNFLGIPENHEGEIEWQKFIPVDDLLEIIPSIEKAYQNRDQMVLEHKVVRHDGEIRWLYGTGNPRYIKGEFKGFIGSNFDITDRKKAEEDLGIKNSQLVRINNELDNFIYTASHDLKAPIINIEGLVNALKSNFKDSLQYEKTIPLFDMINVSVDRFKNTIKDLTEVAKLQNDLEEDRNEILFDDILEEVKLIIQNQIEEAKAEIKVDFGGAPSILFSKKNLRSILYNLVSNAVKYNDPERPVKVIITTSYPDNKHLLLSVKDNGLGLKEGDKEKIFIMFKRLHQHVEGTGIGLSIVKKIIDNNGGRIEVESEIKKGTEFKIYFKL
jgi:PAS domain S-box-containing protein